MYKTFVTTSDQITQMAYSSWPDHGVPEHSDEFVGFLEEVRHHREGSIHPTLVHCSAGIGRTGVLILMETAMCLIEANEVRVRSQLCSQIMDISLILTDRHARTCICPYIYYLILGRYELSDISFFSLLSNGQW